MKVLSKIDIREALERLSVGLGRYQWLQANLLKCDVSKDRDFQRRFNAFYRVRRGDAWRVAFFALMENSKSTGIDFAQALRALAASTGRFEASFASKLVATLDPLKPVIDKFVLGYFELRLPYPATADREERTISVYQQLSLGYSDIMAGSLGGLITTMFDARYPEAGISNLKKIDLVLWQTR